jgi:hypothetical protein
MENLTKIENLERGLTAPQVQKLEAVRHKIAVALARQYGTRLAPFMADKLEREVILRPEVLAHVEGATVAELPTDATGWGLWAKQAVEADEFALRSIASSDDDLRQRLANEVLASIPPAKRIAMARDEGTLDQYVAEHVEVRFEQEIARGHGYAV